MDCVDVDTLAFWLCERQLPSGGLNGRPEKLEDVRLHFSLSLCFFIVVNESVQVCYSFWVLSALSILRKVHWIDVDKLVAFILSAQVSLASLSARITVCCNPFLSGHRERGYS